MGLERITVVDRWGKMQATINEKMTGTCIGLILSLQEKRVGSWEGARMQVAKSFKPSGRPVDSHRPP